MRPQVLLLQTLLFSFKSEAALYPLAKSLDKGVRKILPLAQSDFFFVLI